MEFTIPETKESIINYMYSDYMYSVCRIFTGAVYIRTMTQMCCTFWTLAWQIWNETMNDIKEQTVSCHLMVSTSTFWVNYVGMTVLFYMYIATRVGDQLQTKNLPFKCFFGLQTCRINHVSSCHALLLHVEWKKQNAGTVTVKIEQE